MAYRRSPEARPPARGFDESCGLMYSNDRWEFHPERPENYRPYPPQGEPVGTRCYSMCLTRCRMCRCFRAIGFAASPEPVHGDVTMEIDWSVGEIMQALKNAGVGAPLPKNTIDGKNVWALIAGELGARNPPGLHLLRPPCEHSTSQPAVTLAMKVEAAFSPDCPVRFRAGRPPGYSGSPDSSLGRAPAS